MSDLSKLYHEEGGRRTPVYRLLSVEGIGPEDDRLVVKKWGRNDRAGTRRYQVFDMDERLVFDTDDCYDSGNALHSVMQWLAKRDEQYKAKHADEA